jgi:hypothetical protein
MRRTLHEAMNIILNEANGIPVDKLAQSIRALDLYSKMDGSKLQPNQIRARVHQYPQLFYIEGNKVYRK